MCNRRLKIGIMVEEENISRDATGEWCSGGCEDSQDGPDAEDNGLSWSGGKV
jgi:hypothetical protein